MPSIIRAARMGFDYIKYSDESEEQELVNAIQEVDLSVEKGEFVAILGHNGSGKSTLAKHINALLVPTRGTMWVDGINTAEVDELWKIRQKAGMVFQNPDNQIIGTVVDEDVAFGPERERSPNRLSGGQKQRVAIAGVVAMHPECIVLDEPTAMLDPNGREEVLEVIRELNREEGVTVILITHYMEEVVFADRVYVMSGGRIVMEGTPREIFSKVDELKSYRLTVPQATELAYELKKAGIAVPDGVITMEELVDAVIAAGETELC